MSDTPPGGVPPTVEVSPSAAASDQENHDAGHDDVPVHNGSEDVVMYSDGSNGADESSGSTDDAESSEGDFVLEQVYENDRRYANETFCFPNDEVEETRLAIVHQVHLLLLKGQLTMCHITSRTRRILDVGAGPGDWAIAMGEMHPRTQIIATDITTYRPTNVPSNVTFQIEDSSQEWTWAESFDLIHMRDLYGVFRDPGHVYKEAAKSLNLSGTLEVANSGPFRLRRNFETSYTKEWCDACQEAMEHSGFAWWNGYTDKQLIEESGLRIQREQHMVVLLGEHMENAEQRRIGRMALVATSEAVEACSLRILTRYLGWTREQVTELNEKVKAELADPSNGAYLEVQYIVAKRLPGLDV